MLSLAKVNAYVIAKQHLLPGYKARGVVQAARDAVGLHATDAMTPYISLWNRVCGFEKGMLEAELYEARSLLRLRAMRGTLFLFTRGFAPVAFSATRYARRSPGEILRTWGVSRSEYERLRRAIEKMLAGGPMTSKEMHAAFPKKGLRDIQRKAGKATYMNTNLFVAWRVMEESGLVTSGKPSGASRVFAENLYETAPMKLTMSEEKAKTRLLEAYLAAYGPVVEDDIAWWADYTKGEVRRLLAGMEIEYLEIESLDGEYMMLRDDCERLKKFDGKPKSLLFLPYEDPYAKAYRARSRLVDEEHDRSFYVGGSAQPCVLIDGRVAGLWKWKQGKLQVEVFGKFAGREPVACRKARKLERFLLALTTKKEKS
ncbi:MAG: AlkZ family DNA glycosylase [Euryarchaeota archaeon]|nr:AlkZ family DNA glycosylase [Euryarchaeota archaeon]